MTSTTYHRLLLPQLLPEEVTRAIWLDCDLLVTTDLVRLWETDLGGFHLLAVRDSVVPLEAALSSCLSEIAERRAFLDHTVPASAVRNIAEQHDMRRHVTRLEEVLDEIAVDRLGS